MKIVAATEIVGHRGSGRQPENTMAAFKQGVADGADRIELDIRRTRDGHYIAIHDSELERTTNGTGKVEERDLSYIESLDAGDGSPPPKLQEVIAWAESESVPLNIEVKSAEPGELAAIVKNSNLQEPWVISFDHGFVGEFQELAPEVTTGRLFSPKGPRKLAGATALLSALAGGLVASRVGLNPAWVAPAAGLGGLVTGWLAGQEHTRRQLSDSEFSDVDMALPHHSLVNGRFMDSAERNGLEVVPYTVNSLDKGSKLVEAGVDGLITDHPEIFRS